MVYEPETCDFSSSLILRFFFSLCFFFFQLLVFQMAETNLDLKTHYPGSKPKQNPIFRPMQTSLSYDSAVAQGRNLLPKETWQALHTFSVHAVPGDLCLCQVVAAGASRVASQECSEGRHPDWGQ